MPSAPVPAERVPAERVPAERLPAERLPAERLPSESAVMSSTELVEHVDVDGKVIDVVTRAAIRRGTLLHRCTYIAVVDSKDRLVVHRRADWKDVYPGWWDIAFGGICGVGEDWVSAARRELAEEAGLTGEALWPLGTTSYDADDGRVLGEVYLVRSDAEPSCPDTEVVEIDRVSMAELTLWIEGRSVCTDSCTVVLPLLLDALR